MNLRPSAPKADALPSCATPRSLLAVCRGAHGILRPGRRRRPSRPDLSGPGLAFPTGHTVARRAARAGATTPVLPSSRLPRRHEKAIAVDQQVPLNSGFGARSTAHDVVSRPSPPCAKAAREVTLSSATGQPVPSFRRERPVGARAASQVRISPGPPSAGRTPWSAGAPTGRSRGFSRQKWPPAGFSCGNWPLAALR